MPVTQITTHTTDGLNRLLTQYQGKPKLEAIIRALIDQIQDAEDGTYSLYGRLDIDNSSGQQLDNIGTIVGRGRGDLTDAKYRIKLYFQIGKNTSQGAAEKITSLMKLLTGAAFVHNQNLGNAEIMLGVDADIAADDVDDFYQEMQDVVAGGVRLNYIICYDNGDAFAFDGTNTNAPAKGFGDTGDAGAGGKLGTLKRYLIPFAFDGDDLSPEGFGAIEDPRVGGVLQST